MENQHDALGLLEAVLTNSCETSQTLYIKTKQLHHFLKTSPNSVIRSALILSTKLKNQQKVSRENFRLFEIYIKKILSKDPNAKLELTHNIKSIDIEKLKIFVLFNFDKINIKRLNYAFGKIKHWVDWQYVKNAQIKIWKFLRIVNKFNQKYRKKILCEVFGVLKTKDFKVFRFREKLLIMKVFSWIVGNCKGFNEQVCLWKWKRCVMKISYYAKGIENFNIKTGFFSRFEEFYWVRNYNLCSVSSLQSLKVCWNRLNLRIFMQIKLNFGYWKNAKNFRILSRFDDYWVKSLQRLIRICSLLCLCRLKSEFYRLYINSLKDEKFVEMRLARKINRMKFFSNFEERHGKENSEDLQILASNYMKNIKIVAIRRDKAEKSLSFGCNLEGNYRKTMKILMDYMKSIYISREKIQVRGIFTWINEVNNKNKAKMLRLFKFYFNKTEFFFETYKWVFKKIKEFGDKVIEKGLSILATKAFSFKIFQSVIVKKWKNIFRVKLNNHKTASRILENLEIKFDFSNLNLQKTQSFSILSKSKVFKNSKKLLTGTLSHPFVYLSSLNQKIKLNFDSNKKFPKVDQNMLKTINFSSIKYNLKSLNKLNLFLTWRLITLQKKTQELKKFEKFHKLDSILSVILQSHKLYFFTLFTGHKNFSPAQEILLKCDKTLQQYFRIFFNQIVFYNKLAYAQQDFNLNLGKKLFFRFQCIIKNQCSQVYSDIILASTLRTILQKCKSVSQIVYSLKIHKKRLKCESLTHWKSLFHSTYIKRKYILIIINSTSINYSTAFWRWVNTIKKSHQCLHTKPHLLLTRLNRIFRVHQKNFKFQTFLKISASGPVHSESELSPRFESKKSNLSELNDSESTQDKTNNSIYLSYSKEEHINFRSLGAAKVIVFNFSLLLIKKLLHAFCGLQYGGKVKTSEKIFELIKQKKSILAELRPITWRNLDLKLRKKQITRQVKLSKKLTNTLITILKRAKISQILQRIQNRLQNSSKFSFIILKLTNN